MMFKVSLVIDTIEAETPEEAARAFRGAIGEMDEIHFEVSDHNGRGPVQMVTLESES